MVFENVKIDLPKVYSFSNAETYCHEYHALLTAGPFESEVSHFNHPNHKIVSFFDYDYRQMGSVQLEDVEEMLSWAENQHNILVHCQYGVSRSTATAWGICILKGMDPAKSLDMLYHNQLQDFWPNILIVHYLSQIFGNPHLAEILQDHHLHYSDINIINPYFSKGD